MLRRLVGLVCVLAAARAPSARAEAPDFSRTPVLFVHGHGLSSKDFQPMMAHLQAAGYPREYLHAVDIVPNTMANRRAAESVLAPAVTALLASAATAARKAGHQGAAPRRVDLVGHSMGAVSSRWYAARLHPERVRTWIALAGANHGTNALCGLSDPASRELCPAFGPHAVQAGLNGTDGAPLDETPHGLGRDRAGVKSVPADATRAILYLTVWLDPDAWIVPARSGTVDGAGGAPLAVPAGVPVTETSPGNFRFDARVEHDPLLYHPDLLRLVTAMLAARDRGPSALDGTSVATVPHRSRSTTGAKPIQRP